MASLSLAFDIIAKDRASDTLDKVGGKADGLGSKLGKVGKIAATAIGGAAVAAVGGFSAALAQGVKDAVSFETLQRKTEAVLRSTGNAAGTSVKGVQDLAASLEHMSGVDEELIINSQNVLATFTQVRNVGQDRIFDKATASALNMSVALGQDLQGATTMLGKALNDPIKGVTALGRAGVQFTQAQKDQIRAMVESGNVMGAQKIILGELETQFGGVAKAAGSGLAGDMARLKDAFSDAFRELGTRILPHLSEFATWAAARLPGAIDTVVGAFSAFASLLRDEVVPVVQRVVEFMRDHWQPILGALAAVVAGVVVPAFIAWAAAAGSAAAAQIAAAAPAIALAGAIAAVAAGVVYAYQNFEGFRNVVDGVARFFIDTAWPMVQRFADDIVKKFGELRDYAATIWPQIREAIGHAINAAKVVIETTLGVIRVVWRTVGDEMLGYARAVWDTIGGVVEGAMKAIQGGIKTVLAVINGDWSDAWDGIKTVLAGVWDSITAVVRGGIAAAHMVIKGGIDTIAAVWRTTWGAMRDFFGGVMDRIKGIVAPIIDWIIDKVEWAARRLSEVREMFDFGADLSRGSVVGGVRLGGQRALGGPVMPRSMYLVGERGPEMFVPHSSGTIVPNHALGGPVHTELHIHGDIYGVDDLRRTWDDWYQGTIAAGAARRIVQRATR
jgi:phage-related minor tail protein